MKKSVVEKLVDDYSLMLLNWAVKKLGNRQQAEDLVQNVWMEIFRAIKTAESKGEEIISPEHFIWKIAHYVWCHYLRDTNSKYMINSIDEYEIADKSNFEEQFVEDDENQKLIFYMRKIVCNLNYLQREIMVSYYMDQLSVKEIAGKLKISESIVKWHLFDTRKKVKQEIIQMEKETKNDVKVSADFVYRPKRLHMACCGSGAPTMDFTYINDSLTKQNICIACYKEPKTLSQLNEMLGIPKAYLENDLKWLIEKEFIIEGKKGFSTNFSISNQQITQDIYGIFLKNKAQLSDIIIQGLLDAEERIRAIGFYGNDEPMEKLLWHLIYWFSLGVQNPFNFVEPPVHSDGGKYFALGFEDSYQESVTVNVDVRNWGYNGAMTNGNPWTDEVFMWFGLYNFSMSDIIDVAIDHFTIEGQILNDLLRRILNSDFCIKDLEEEEKDNLAKLVQKGFITVNPETGKVYPRFSVFTRQQRDKLYEIFAEINAKLENGIQAMKKDIEEYYEKGIPVQLEGIKEFFCHHAFMDLGFITTVFAFNEGKLFVPKDSKEGEFLTLVYIKK